MNDPKDERRRRRLREIISSTPGLTVNSWSKAAKIPESVLREFLNETNRTLTLTTYDKLAQARGTTVGDLLGEVGRKLPVVGYAGAGEEIFALDDSLKGAGLDEIDAPPGAADDAVAVIVRGDSMFPAYWDGDILIYRRNIPFDRDSCLYNECVVRTRDGRVFIKRVMPGSSGMLFTLQSYNAPPILDAALEWAAPIDIADKRHRRPRVGPKESPAKQGKKRHV